MLTLVHWFVHKVPRRQTTCTKRTCCGLFLKCVTVAQLHRWIRHHDKNVEHIKTLITLSWRINKENHKLSSRIWLIKKTSVPQSHQKGRITFCYIDGCSIECVLPATHTNPGSKSGTEALKSYFEMMQNEQNKAFFLRLMDITLKVRILNWVTCSHTPSLPPVYCWLCCCTFCCVSISQFTVSQIN